MMMMMMTIFQQLFFLFFFLQRVPLSFRPYPSPLYGFGFIIYFSLSFSLSLFFSSFLTPLFVRLFSIHLIIFVLLWLLLGIFDKVRWLDTDSKIRRCRRAISNRRAMKILIVVQHRVRRVPVTLKTIHTIKPNIINYYRRRDYSKFRL